MKIDIISKDGYKASARFEKILKEKLERLGKYFDDNAKIRVVCRKVGKQEKLEITITGNNSMYRSEVLTDSMYDNIDIAMPKLEKQIVRYNSKKKDKSRKTLRGSEGVLPFEFLEEEPETLPSIFKKKTFNLEPMLPDEARFAIDRLDQSFYVFLNARTGRVNVLYRRADGNFGLIDLNY